MAYIVTQVSGERYDQAREYVRLRLVDMAAAQDFYRKTTGEQGPDPTSVWWIYNADDALARRNSVTAKEIRSFLHLAEGKIIDSNAWARAVCAIATRKHGGEWKYYYEY